MKKIEKYLTTDIVGPYSGIVYGKKDDKVEFIKECGNMVLVENKGERFHVWPDKLSDNGSLVVEPEEVVIEEKKDIVPTWLPKEITETVVAEPTDLFGAPVQKKKSRKK